MSFNSIDFLIFLPIVVLGYFLLPEKAKNIWLLIASYYFYMCWNARYALLIFTSTIVTYFSGIFIEKIKRSDRRGKKKLLKKAAVACCLIINLGILFFFKYYNFTADVFTKILGKINISVRIPTIDVLLPVGISFYTFQALSYTIDVYRDDISAEKNFFKYALFVSFFPQLVAGPIERSKNLLNQLSESHKFSFDNAREGFLLMLWGFFLKIVIADRVAVFVDTAYGNYTVFPGYYLVVATILFAVQIYCDFSGYSTIAMGAAKILGISLTDNFNAPYLSLTVSEFWRKWHISLTSWFKDYLYIPLGGSRKGSFRKYVNRFIVFLVSGLWHGAAVTYLIWGALNGLYQIVGDLTKPVRNRVVKALGLHRDTFAHKLLRMAGTFALIDFSWIFFRSAGYRQAAAIIKSVFTSANIWIFFDDSLYNCGLDRKNFLLAVVCILILIAADCLKKKGIVIRKLIVKQDWWFQCLLIALAVSAILLFGKWGPEFNKASFIYFRF